MNACRCGHGLVRFFCLLCLFLFFFSLSFIWCKLVLEAWCTDIYEVLPTTKTVHFRYNRRTYMLVNTFVLVFQTFDRMGFALPSKSPTWFLHACETQNERLKCVCVSMDFIIHFSWIAHLVNL